MTTHLIRPGEPATFTAASPTAPFAVMFEDDGATGYLYAVDLDRPDAERILDAVMIYQVDRLPEQVRERETDVEIVWSADGLTAGLRIAGGLQAVVDFAARRAFCRMNFPPVSAAWGGGARGAWDDGLAARLG